MLDIVVDGMTCDHCVRAVTDAVSPLPGVTGVAVDLGSGNVRIQGDPDVAVVRAAIEEEGYTLRASPPPPHGTNPG